MRPVQLEMTGFASFREATTVNFEDADYFALIGPTGAGKSTLIDAITFALYGSVARWDKENVVAPALAPTAARGTVKLVFDARGARYIAMREVVRSAKGQVNVRTARLERLVDPTALGGPDDDIEEIADQSGSKKAVEDLLGLDFNQFTKCVALPQGDVAEFLHAPASERQKILTKLLGIEIYQRIGQAAGSRATHEETVADTLEGTIATTPDADEEALTTAEARVDDLQALGGRFEEALPQLQSRTRAVAEADVRVAGVEAECALLAGLEVPAGVAELDHRRREAGDALIAAQDRIAAAEATDDEARLAVQAGPQRAHLEGLAQRHVRLAALEADLPRRTKVAGARAVERDTLKTALHDLKLAVTHAEVTRAERSGDRASAEEQLTMVVAGLDLLKDVAAPAELEGVQHRRETLDGQRRDAELALVTSRSALATARAARDSAGDPVALDRAENALSLVLQAIERASEAHGTAEAASEKAQDAEAKRLAARAELEAKRAAVDTARHADAAAALRPHLVLGEPCPVCEQAVASLPAAAAGASLMTLEDALTRAKQAFEVLDRTTSTVIAAAAVDQAAAEAAVEALDRAASGLGLDEADPVASATSLRASVHEQQAAAEAAADSCQSAERSLAAAEAARDQLAEALRSIEDEVTAARTSLLTDRDRLVTLGPPAVDAEDPVNGWAALVTWAAAEADVRRKKLAPLQKALTKAVKDLSTAETAVENAIQARDAGAEAHASAITAASEAQGLVESATKDRDEHLAALQGQPTSEEVQALLTDVLAQEAAAEAAHTALLELRGSRERAEQQARGLEAELASARSGLSAARDRLVGLGAPALEGVSLADGWDQLATWAATLLGSRQADLVLATAAAATTRADLVNDESSLRAELADKGVTGPESPVSDWAPASLAGARATANADVARVLEQQDKVESYRAKAVQAREQSQVARQLANLLRADALPRWLTSNALRVLVAAASDTLLDLTGGQFELLSDESGFQIVDHNDADSVRGVKTLSGGETFQAALALALALSSQLGALSSSGAAQLEAIFIDEGFGTLDEVTLDTVASTLEELATSGGRMVGLITHVPALAARVPVRFVVNRDAHGSHVKRE